MAKKPKPQDRAEDAGDSLFGRLRLIELGVENFKRVRAVTIRPAGHMTVVSGRNRQGKTSTLDAFTALFTGKKGVTRDPIRDDENSAQVWAILGKDGEPAVTLTRRFKRDPDGGEATTDLIVEGADGRKYGTPQAVASALYAPIAFDPLKFREADPKAQVETLKALVPGFDFAANAQTRKSLFDERTDIGRDASRAEARAASIQVPAGPKPQRVDMAEVLAQINEANEFNTLIQKRAANRARAQEDLERTRDELEQAEARVRALKAEIAGAEKMFAEADALPPAIDTAELQAELAGAEQTNAAVALFEQREAARQEAKAATAAYDALTAKIAALDQAKKDAIAAAKLPVEGLEFDEDGVTLNGHPFADASGAESLRASTLLAMAMHPDLAVVVIREGALLDDDSMAMLEKMATEFDFDVLIERVTNGERVGFVIEDGEVVS
jgi:hypothetical protein